jgi:hypothetical protein
LDGEKDERTPGGEGGSGCSYRQRNKASLRLERKELNDFILACYPLVSIFHLSRHHWQLPFILKDQAWPNGKPSYKVPQNVGEGRKLAGANATRLRQRAGPRAPQCSSYPRTGHLAVTAKQKGIESHLDAAEGSILLRYMPAGHRIVQAHQWKGTRLFMTASSEPITGLHNVFVPARTWRRTRIALSKIAHRQNKPSSELLGFGALVGRPAASSSIQQDPAEG